MQDYGLGKGEMNNYPNITYKKVCNPCNNKGKGYPKVSYKPSLLREQVTPATPEVPAKLRPLAEEAVKYDTFDEFETAFLTEIKHGRYYHITDNPNFVLDPTKVPTDMSSLAGGGLQTPGFMITSDLPTWVEQFPGRKYVAIVDMSQVPKEMYRQVKRGFGNEFWVDDLSKIKVEKVVSLAEAKRDFTLHQNALEKAITGRSDLEKFYNEIKGKSVIPKAESNPTAYPSVSYSTLKEATYSQELQELLRFLITAPGKELTEANLKLRFGDSVFNDAYEQGFIIRGPDPSPFKRAVYITQKGRQLLEKPSYLKQTVGVKIKPLKENIWLVNGQQVRDTLDVDFVLGGHDLRYPFIPKGEIWIDEATKPEERDCLIAHEVEEQRLMAEGVEYSKAHEAANVVEAECRSVELLASAEGNPIRKFCCRQCSECAPKELLEEGKFADRIAWLRHHYMKQHPSTWGKQYPEVKYKVCFRNNYGN